MACHGRKEMDVGIGRHPALLPPGQHLLDLDHDLFGGRLDLVDSPQRGRISNPLGNLDIDLAQRQLEDGLAVDVGAGVDRPGRACIHMPKIRAVIFIPGQVEQARPVDRGQVFAGFAMDMQLDRHRPPRRPFRPPLFLRFAGPV